MNKLTLLKALVTKNVPIYVHYGITHRCNLRCRTCGIWKTGDKSAELDSGQIDRMAEVLKKIGTQVISIGGGEPLMRDDLPEAAQSFIKRGISVRVLSNGIPVSMDRLKSVLDAGVSNFSISLDSLDPKIQDGITGQEGGFEKTLETLRFLSPVIKKRKGIGIINTVVSSVNVDRLADMVKFAGGLGFYISFVPLEMDQMHAGGAGCMDNLKDFDMSENQKKLAEKSFKELAARKRQGEPIFNSSSFLEAAGRRLAGENFSWKCLAGSLYFSISPGGMFSICHNFRGYTGEGADISVLGDDFPVIFNSPEYKEGILKLRKECRVCFRPCWAEISYLFSDTQALLEMVRIYF
jgi:MoaA/NifB/PqqE/SkfB family radical SAM enzyme